MVSRMPVMGSPHDGVSIDEARKAKEIVLSTLRDSRTRVAGVGIAPQGDGGFSVDINLPKRLSPRAERKVTQQVASRIGNVPFRMRVVGRAKPFIFG